MFAGMAVAPRVFMLLCISWRMVAVFFLFCFALFARSKPEDSVVPEATLALLTWPRHCRDGFQQWHHSERAGFGWFGHAGGTGLFSLGRARSSWSCWYLWFLFFDCTWTLIPQSLRLVWFPLSIQQNRALVLSPKAVSQHTTGLEQLPWMCWHDLQTWKGAQIPEQICFSWQVQCSGPRGWWEKMGGWKMQRQRSEPAKTKFLIAPGDLKSEVVSLMHWGCSWFLLDNFVFKSQSPAKLQWGWVSDSPRESQELWGLLPLQLPAKGTLKLLQIICHLEDFLPFFTQNILPFKMDTWTEQSSVSLKLHVSTAGQLKCVCAELFPASKNPSWNLVVL